MTEGVVDKSIAAALIESFSATIKTLQHRQDGQIGETFCPQTQKDL